MYILLTKYKHTNNMLSTLAKNYVSKILFNCHCSLWKALNNFITLISCWICGLTEKLIRVSGTVHVKSPERSFHSAQEIVINTSSKLVIVIIKV